MVQDGIKEKNKNSEELNMLHFIHRWADVKEVYERSSRHLTVISHHVYQECLVCGKRRIIDVMPEGSKGRVFDFDWLAHKS